MGNRVTGLALRMMRPGDLPAVIAVEQASFAAGWPPTAFERELSTNQMARYLVLVRGDGADERVLGFAGLWLMLDEAHVVTVAVAPEERGKGLGRLLVYGLVSLAAAHEMSVATLECRVSNAAARALYGRYGFYEVGMRKKYYSDNGEDAVIMTTELLASAAYQRRLAALAAELGERVPGVSLAIAAS
jgi:ribosomal-protein-alanine N-acetyltransferase